MLEIPIESWTVYEQKHYVELANKKVKIDKLKFSSDFGPKAAQSSDVLILSSVIQYLEDPYDFCQQLVNQSWPYLYIDRTCFSLENRTRLSVQKILTPRSNIPCWFLEREKIDAIFRKNYNLLFEFSCNDAANLPSVYRGFLLERKTL